jgi:hypothetical protein
MRYTPSYQPAGWFERFMTSRRALTIGGVVAGAVVGGAIAYELPLLWFVFANGLSDTSGSGRGISGLLWLAPVGAIVGAVVGGLVMSKRTELLRGRLSSELDRPPPLIAHPFDFDPLDRSGRDNDSA